MKAKYVLGFPRIALPVLRAELPGHLMVLFFFLAPMAACCLVFTSPAPGKWEKPAAAVMGLVALSSFGGLAISVGSRFGLRVVPRLDRRLDVEIGTYSHGRALIGKIERLDRLAKARGLVSLSDLGVGEPDRTPGDLWFDSAAGRVAILALLDAAKDEGYGRRVGKDLERIAAALTIATAAGARFRLVVVSGTTMNAIYFNQLRNAGF